MQIRVIVCYRSLRNLCDSDSKTLIFFWLDTPYKDKPNVADKTINFKIAPIYIHGIS